MRDYSSSTGRYIQRDPLSTEGGVNLYLYIDANPLIYSDPRGLANSGWQPSRSMFAGGLRSDVAHSNLSIGTGGSFHLGAFGLGADSGVVVDTNNNICFYSNICYTVGPGASASVGVVGALSSGQATSSVTQYQGACWSGGSGVGGSGSILAAGDGSMSMGRGLAGPSVGAQATYQSCRVQYVCLKN